MKKTSLIGLLAGLAAAGIWGGMYVVSKVVLDVVPPFALLTTRLVLGFISLWVIVASRGGFTMRGRRIWLSLGTGLVGYGVSLGLQFVGTRLSTAANGALVTSATPALILPFAVFLLGERISARRLAAVAVASLGVAAVIDPRTARFSSGLFLGNLCLLGAALTWALYSVLVRRLSLGTSQAPRGTELVQASAVMLLGGLPATLPLGIWELATQGTGAITPGIIGGILFLGIISTAVAMFLWNYAFTVLPASTASLTFFAQPVVGTLLGWLFLGETITPLFVAGGVLIGIGILVSNERS